MIAAPYGLSVDPIEGVVYGRYGRPVGYHGTNGYMHVSLSEGNRTRKLLAHRIIWESVHGPIPPGLEVNHLNGVKDDNRIENLEVVTKGDNQRHAFATGLREVTRCCKLSPDDVRGVLDRLSSGETHRSIAAVFGVGEATISSIAVGRNWRHIVDAYRAEKAEAALAGVERVTAAERAIVEAANNAFYDDGHANVRSVRPLYDAVRALRDAQEAGQ